MVVAFIAITMAHLQQWSVWTRSKHCMLHCSYNVPMVLMKR